MGINYNKRLSESQLRDFMLFKFLRGVKASPFLVF